MKIGKNGSRGCSLCDNQKSYRQMDTSIEFIMSNMSRNALNELANCSWWVESGG